MRRLAPTMVECPRLSRARTWNANGPSSRQRGVTRVELEGEDVPHRGHRRGGPGDELYGSQTRAVGDGGCDVDGTAGARVHVRVRRDRHHRRRVVVEHRLRHAHTLVLRFRAVGQRRREQVVRGERERHRVAIERASGRGQVEVVDVARSVVRAQVRAGAGLARSAQADRALVEAGAVADGGLDLHETGARVEDLDAVRPGERRRSGDGDTGDPRLVAIDAEHRPGISGRRAGGVSDAIGRDDLEGNAGGGARGGHRIVDGDGERIEPARTGARHVGMVGDAQEDRRIDDAGAGAIADLCGDRGGLAAREQPGAPVRLQRDGGRALVELDLHRGAGELATRAVRDCRLHDGRAVRGPGERHGGGEAGRVRGGGGAGSRGEERARRRAHLEGQRGHASRRMRRRHCRERPVGHCARRGRGDLHVGRGRRAHHADVLLRVAGGAVRAVRVAGAGDGVGTAAGGEGGKQGEGDG